MITMARIGISKQVCHMAKRQQLGVAAYFTPDPMTGINHYRYFLNNLLGECLESK